MGLLDGIIGGAVGAGLTNVVTGLLEKHGGVQGLAAELQSKGLGGAVQSWISAGPNQAISADQIHQALGSDAVKDLAAKIGMSPDDLAQKLAQFLPQAIDKMTPNGAIPKS